MEYKSVTSVRCEVCEARIDDGEWLDSDDALATDRYGQEYLVCRDCKAYIERQGG